MKLDKTNAELIKNLRGEYGSFAVRLQKMLFKRCYGKREINERLTEIYDMLLSAQNEGRQFSDVIADETVFMRETIVYFEPKTSKLAIIIYTIFCLLLAGVALLYFYHAEWKKIELSAVDSVNFSKEDCVLEWEPVENATEYVITFDDGTVFKERGNRLSLWEYINRTARDSYTLSIVATDSTQQRTIDAPPSKPFTFSVTYPTFEWRLRDGYMQIQGNNASYIRNINTYHSVWKNTGFYSAWHVTFTPE
ncbi:MAG: hypothetical protein J6Z36_05065, partial [Clostridia bacterium]|nr:hypothetical protein [Clostridia bacterium]